MILRDMIAKVLREPLTADEAQQNVTEAHSSLVMADRVIRVVGDVVAVSDRLREELNALRGARLLSAVFGHHAGAPQPFSLYRVPDRSPVALGALFPDGAVAMRTESGGWMTRSEGGVERIAAMGYEVVWLSDELESLAQQEKQTEAICAVYEALRQELCSKCRAGFCSAHQPAQGILEALGGGEADPKPATTTTDPTRKDPDDHP